jgi:hypothetical protein
MSANMFAPHKVAPSPSISIFAGSCAPRFTARGSTIPENAPAKCTALAALIAPPEEAGDPTLAQSHKPYLQIIADLRRWPAEAESKQTLDSIYFVVFITFF